MLVFAAGLGADEGLGAVGKRCQALGRDAGRTENFADHAERSSWLQGRGLSGRGHHAMVHCRHRWLQRVNQGELVSPDPLPFRLPSPSIPLPTGLTTG